LKAKCQHCSELCDISDKELDFNEKVSYTCTACLDVLKDNQKSTSTKESKNQDPNKHHMKKDKTTTPPSSSNDSFLSSKELKQKILGSVKNLPAMPQTVHKAQKIISNKDSNFKDLADILKIDTAIAAMVLKMANSTYYGLSGKISSIQHASVILGYKTLLELITMAGASKLLGDTLPGYGLGAIDLWRHSMGVAFGARIIANRKSPALANDAFSAGLIHDAGKLILDPYILERKEAFESFMKEAGKTFLDAEKQILGFDHGEIASEVCKSWQTPKILTSAIQYHHYPGLANNNELTNIVHTADIIALMTGLGTGIDGIYYEADGKVIDNLGLGYVDINHIMVEVAESVDQISAQMN